MNSRAGNFLPRIFTRFIPIMFRFVRLLRFLGFGGNVLLPIPLYGKHKLFHDADTHDLPVFAGSRGCMDSFVLREKAKAGSPYRRYHHSSECLLHLAGLAHRARRKEERIRGPLIALAINGEFTYLRSKFPFMRKLLLPLLLAAGLSAHAQKFELIKDAFPGAMNGHAHTFGEFQGGLFYGSNIAVGTATDYALWRTDGTPGNAQMLKQLSGQIMNFAVLNNWLYFRTSGHEIWKTDGTALGTQLIESFFEIQSHLVAFNGKIYFTGMKNSGDQQQLYATDGSTGNATLASNYVCNGSGADITEVVVSDNKLYINPIDQVSPTCSHNLYATDGFSPFVQLTSFSTGVFVEQVTPFGTGVAFTAHDGTNGEELWITDGTQPNTQMVTDLNPGSASSSPKGLMPWGATLLFFADNGAGFRSLWKTDGTSGGTFKVRDSVINATSGNQSPYLVNFGKLYFRGEKDFASGSEGIYMTDMSMNGTSRVVAVPSIPTTVPMAVLGNYVYANPKNGSNIAFLKFDGINFLDTIDAPLKNNPTYLGIQTMTVFNNAIYLNAALDSDTGSEVYKFRDIPNSVEEVNYTRNTARIYPLPVHDHATLELFIQGNIGDAEVAMYDMTGRLVSAPVRTQLSTGINKLDINTASLTGGMYQVVVRGDDYNEVIKIVK